MKRSIRILCLALALMLLTLSCAAAETQLSPTKNRKIKLNPNVGLNEIIEGVSPTTGLTLADYDVPDGFAGLAATGLYTPMMVQISNDNGGIDSVAPWGASYADIVYETPLYSQGVTRLSFIFSDLIPDSVGPIRSARLGHAWIREEWDAGFLYYGQQEYAETDVVAEFNRLGAVRKRILFSGTVGEGKEWKQYYSARAGIPAPNNKDANVAAMTELIPETHVFPNHAFKFTDTVPSGKNVKKATEIYVKWGEINYGSNIKYDPENNVYYRYMRREKNKLVPWEDRDTGEMIGFTNVIVQFVDVTWPRFDAPKATMVGEGNADFFMGGVHVMGYWKRDSMTSRTVFYAEDGNEVELLRGKTLIITFPKDSKNGKKVTYK